MALLSHPARILHRSVLLCLLTTTVVLTGCGSWWLPRPHKIDIQQGNLLPPAAVAEIAEGMSRREVVAILGEPIITSLFNGNRWDYVYSINRSGEKPKPQRVTVFFENDRVSSLEKEGIPEAG